MRKKEVELSIQKFSKIIIATISLICMIVSLWIIIDCFNIKKEQKNLIANYSTNTNIDYKVYLKSNRFYEKDYMEKDKKYISSIINYIDLNLSHRLSINTTSNTTYGYSVNAKIVSEYEQNGVKAELWSKSFQLVPYTSFKKDNGSGYQLNENLKIDYSMYDNMAKKFKEEYAVAADTNLTITISIKSTSNLTNVNEPVSEVKNIKLVMPLNKTVTDVTVSGVEPLNESIYETVQTDQKMNMPLLIGAIVILIASIVAAIITFYKLFKVTNLSQYLLEQKKILKSYPDIIAEVTSKPNLRKENVVDVKKFEDLINIEEELRVPILFYEFKNINESWFLITTETNVFRYSLKEIDDVVNNEFDNNSDLDSNDINEVKTDEPCIEDTVDEGQEIDIRALVDKILEGK